MYDSKFSRLTQAEGLQHARADSQIDSGSHREKLLPESDRAAALPSERKAEAEKKVAKRLGTRSVEKKKTFSRKASTPSSQRVKPPSEKRAAIKLATIEAPADAAAVERDFHQEYLDDARKLDELILPWQKQNKTKKMMQKYFGGEEPPGNFLLTPAAPDPKSTWQMAKDKIDDLEAKGRREGITKVLLQLTRPVTANQRFLSPEGRAAVRAERDKIRDILEREADEESADVPEARGAVDEGLHLDPTNPGDIVLPAATPLSERTERWAVRQPTTLERTELTTTRSRQREPDFQPADKGSDSTE